MRATAALLIGAIVLAAGCRDEKTVNGPDWSSDERLLYFGIPVRVQFTPANDVLEKEVWAYLDSINAVFNDYDATSEVGRINAAATAINNRTITSLRCTMTRARAKKPGGNSNAATRSLRVRT